MQHEESPGGEGHVALSSGQSPRRRRHTVALSFAGFGLGVLACMLAWLPGGAVAEIWENAARLTARVSALFFIAAFGASALAQLWRAGATAWLLRERRGLGLGFCAAHGVHLVAVVGAGITGEAPSMVALVGGTLAYLWVVVMALTSTDAAVARLGAVRWRRLHLGGMHFLWAIFTVGYLGRVLRQDVPLEHAVLFTLMVWVILLRLYQRFHHMR